MKLFENYLAGIENVLNDNYNQFSGPLNKRSKPSDILLKAELRNTSIFNEAAHLQINGDKALLNVDRDGLRKLFGENNSSFQEISIGTHPDFTDVAHSDCTYHHCVSMFVDIKGSTRLGLKNKLEKVRLIKDSLLTLCIHVVNFFGGHVHRLQGDAVFVQFVRKGRYKNDAIINALNAASVLCQFVEKNLSEIFLKKGLTPIKIRIGIDFGKDNQVLWSHYGIPGCAELTTTSLHTDLAAKLQGKAKPNSIVIGDNLVKELDLPEEYLLPIYKIVNGVEVVERYIISHSELNYKQHEFQWKKYLLSYDFINKSSLDGSLEITERDYKIQCEIFDGDNEAMGVIYHQNSASIPKEKGIKFTILYKGNQYTKILTESITWEAINRGEEAKAVLNHDFEKRYHDKSYCYTGAAFLGHHYVKCKITRPNSENINITFPIYVQ